MGLLCDLFVCSPEDALEYENCARNDEETRRSKYSPIELKGLTSLEFGTLWSILEKQPWDANRHMLIDIAFGEDNESWLHEFQHEYLLLLSKLTPGNMNSVASAWGATEEISCVPEDMFPVVEALVQLSNRALVENRRLYMWGSV
ncbi:MAG: hypothetical protein ACRDAM_21535 [Casimicrobium sp.]